MTFTHSKKSRVLLDDAHLSGFLNSASSSGSRAVEDTTVLLDDDRTYAVGLGDGTVSLDGFFDGDTDAIHDQMTGLLGSDDPAPLTYAYAGLDVGQAASLGNVHQVGYDVSSAVASMVTVSINAQVTGGIALGVSLAALSARSSSGDASGHDSGSSSSNGGVGHLHVVDASGTSPTLDVKIQESSDGSSWSDLLTFSQQTGAGSDRQAVTGAVARHLRATWTVGGTSPSFEFTVAFARQ